MIRHAFDLLGKLLDGGHSTIAGRQAGSATADNCGGRAIADEVIAAIIAAVYAIARRRSVQPAAGHDAASAGNRALRQSDQAPLAQDARPVIEAFPHAPGFPWSYGPVWRRRVTMRPAPEQKSELLPHRTRQIAFRSATARPGAFKPDPPA
jgi:hypothetical protein